MAATTADLVQKFIKKDEEVKAKEADFEKAKEERAIIEAELIKRFEHAGTQNMKVNGHTVYLHSQLWAKSAGESWQTVAALKACELADLVEEKFNTHRLSAWVREQVKEKGNGQPLNPEQILSLLPDPLRSTLAITEKTSLRSRKG